jgi:hypothetical protein
VNPDEVSLARQSLAASAGCARRRTRAFLGGEDIRSLSRREVAELMERLGALPSAANLRPLVTIRNGLAHLYPDDPERQVRNVSDAYSAVGDLPAAYESARRYIERRLPEV